MLTATRPTSKVAPLLSAATAAALVFVGINLFHTFGPIHEHNDGPLGGLSGASFAFDAGATGPWTVGYELCLQPGADPAILESITPVSAGGREPVFLGAYVVDPPAGTESLIGGGNVRGFPPATFGNLLPVAGYRVTQECNSSGGEPTGAPQVTSGLYVGVGTPAQSTGGGWSGYTVTYRVDATQYIVDWDTGIYICGPTAPASSGCNPATP
jgi:hypothetical protein